MEKKGSIGKAIVDDILDHMFAELEGLQEFDQDTIKSLKEIRTAGNLKKASVVRKTLESMSEVKQ